METQERAESAEPALDGILGRLTQDLQEFTSRIADRQHTERLVFEQRISAIRKAKEIRQKEKESLEKQIGGLQQRVQELNHEDVADDTKMRQLEIEYDIAAEKWEKTREKWKGQISTALTSIARIPLDPPPEPYDTDGLQQPPIAQHEVQPPPIAQHEVRQPSNAQREVQFETEPTNSTGSDVLRNRSRRWPTKSRRIETFPSPEPAGAGALAFPELVPTNTSQRNNDREGREGGTTRHSTLFRHGKANITFPKMEVLSSVWRRPYLSDSATFSMEQGDRNPVESRRRSCGSEMPNEEDLVLPRRLRRLGATKGTPASA